MMKIARIPLTAVDLDEPLVPGRTPADPGPLTAAMSEVGLLAPPWLRPRGDGRWQVVTGWRRLLAATALQWREVPAWVLPPDTPDCRCLLIHLYDNALTRGFDLLEQALLAAALLKYWDRPTVAAKFLPFLGLPPSAAHLERLWQLAQLEAPFQELAARGRLALTAAARLFAWEPAARAAVLPFLEKLHLSQSKQEEFLDHLDQLARREGQSPQAILSREELRQPLADASLSPQEKTAAVRRQLRRRVYPRLSATLEAFEQALSRLGWKNLPRVRLHPPAAFEGPDFHLEIKFRDAPELQQLLAAVARLSREEDLSALTRL